MKFKGFSIKNSKKQKKKTREENGKENKGITLIALVITIIVLLILAGITINSLTGGDNTMQKAQESKEKTDKSTIKEQLDIAVINSMANENSLSINKEILKGELNKLIEDNIISEYIMRNEEDFPWIVSKGDWKFSINENGMTGIGVVPMVGDTVNYEPSGEYKWDKSLARSDETGEDTLSSASEGKYNIKEWKVLNYNPSTKTVEMVPNRPVGGLRLQGAQGYNNGVYLLNQACSNLYGDSSKGITARSIKEEDFVKAGGYKWTSYRENYKDEEYSSSKVKYGEQKNEAYTSNKKYPSIYGQEKNSVIFPEPDGILKTLNLSEQTDSIKATDYEATAGYKDDNLSIYPYQTYYTTKDCNTTKELLGDKAGVLLPRENSTTYWVASRCNILSGNYCHFDIRSVTQGKLWAEGLFYSNSACYSPSRALFPVVSLSSELLQESGESGVWDVNY